MAVDDVYRAEVFQNVGSEQTMNVLHYREVTPETVLDNPAINVAAIVWDAYTAIAPELSEDWRVIQITVNRVHPLPGIPYTRVLGALDPIEGAIVGDIVPSQAAALISFYSFNTFRTGRGRIYLPGVSETTQNEGQLTENFVSNLQTIVDGTFAEVQGPSGGGDGTYWLTIFGPTTTPSSVQDVIQCTVRPNMATQRRRRAHPGFGA